VINQAALRPTPFKVGGNTYVLVSGAIHFLNRVVPLIYEDKEFYMRAMWHEQPMFNKQLNAIVIVEAISILLFKPGFCVTAPTDAGWQPNYYGKLPLKA
jgi:hypothetical protein